jgi:hypothetical protein
MLHKLLKLLSLFAYQAILFIAYLKNLFFSTSFKLDYNLKNKKIAFFEKNTPNVSSTGERLFLELYAHMKRHSEVSFFIKNNERKQESNDYALNVMEIKITRPIFSRKILIENEYFFVRSPESFIYLIALSFLLFVRPRIIYYSTDIFSKRFKEEFKNNGSLSSFFYSYYYKLNEPLIWKLSEFCLSNREDEELIIKKYNENTSVVPVRVFSNFPKIEIKNFTRKTGKVIDFLFIGGAGNTPNISAMNFVFDELISYFEENLVRDYVIHVVGSGWKDFLNNMQYYSENVVIHGVVTDDGLQCIYNQCLFSLAPLKYGSGVKGKVIEAMYHSLVVITTPVGVEGIKCNTLNSFKTAREMTEECNRVINSENYWLQTVTGYQEYLLDSYSISSLDKGLRI